MKLKSVWNILKETYNEFSEDRVLRLAAATAYYATFSIGPLLVLIIGVAGLVFGEETVRRQVQEQAQALVGAKSADLLGSMMSAQRKGGSLQATLIGGVALVLGASGVFGQLQDSLNTIWGVATRPGAGLGPLIRDRFFSMATVLGTGFLLLVSMALSAFINTFQQYLGKLISLPPGLLPVLNEGVSLEVSALLFALIFKVLPDVRIRWRDVWVGALVTGVLFTGGKFLLGYYLSREAGASAYGAGSALVIILLFVYYASLILYFGAEFTQVYARCLGQGIHPSKYAVQVTDVQRAQQGMPRRKQIEQAARSAAAVSPAPSPTEVMAAQPANQPQASAPEHAPSVTAAAAVEAMPGSPGTVIKAKPWSYVRLAFAFGLAAGALWRLKSLRAALKAVMAGQRGS